MFSPSPFQCQATDDNHLIDLWVRGRASPHTQRAYRGDLARFMAFIGKPLQAVTLGDLQDFSDSLAPLASGSRKRIMASVKSLFSFGQEIGYLPFNPAKVIKLKRAGNVLAERILSETQVQRLLALEANPRNATLLQFIYASGCRVSEVCALRWRDLQAREEAGQVTLRGKGGKSRVVLLPSSLWTALMALGSNEGPDSPVFASRKRSASGTKHLAPTQVHRIVKAAAKRAGLPAGVSPHWLRHAHASHSLNRGAPISLVQQTLGHDSLETTGRYLHARPSDSSALYLGI